MTQIMAVARKEFRAYFGSPMALIFLGAFLIAILFAFFWVETFFARNIADLRPLFRWIPVLLIFLVASLTMRQWSEEQKMGTFEILMTLPVRTSHLVLGKFLAVLGLVAVALALTAGLPITVAFLGKLDWGPVLGGYLGSVLLAGAYIAIGLFVSSRTDNQIVALISTVMACGAIFLLGSPELTGFMRNGPAELMRALGTGSRFDSIERGVLDLRDILYYLSITVFFLLLNVTSLDAKRWSHGSGTYPYRRNAMFKVVLVGLNLMALNLWMYPTPIFRIDLTENRRYSISETTRDLITNLQEPLLLRGYFSAKTHPLLAPLVPDIRDMMQEYAVVSGNRIAVEFVDPREDEEMEAEANRSYGIRPVPFQVAGRYEASVINSYFDILVKYGDQYVVLNFRDLIEVEPQGEDGLDVHLRNLEYDLTRSIKKVVYGFQGIDTILARTSQPIRLTAFVSGNLPKEVADLPDKIRASADSFVQESKGKFLFEEIDPGAPDSPISPEQLEEKYGFRPIASSLFSNESFFLYLALQVGENMEPIFPMPGMSEADLRSEIEAALKRGASGFLKTVGLWTPPPDSSYGSMGRPIPASDFQMVREQINQNYNVKDVDLSTGHVPGDISVLALMAPRGLSDIERFAVDQFLMRGGAVIAASGRYVLDSQSLQTGALGVEPVDEGLETLLEHYGIETKKALVMDLQNEPFPVPVVRKVGMFQVREIRQVNYPFFVDVRRDGMAPDHPIVSNLPAITLQWVSPLSVHEETLKGKDAKVLLRSSKRSWQEIDNMDIQPDFERFGDVGFAVPPEFEQSVLAVAVKGSFDSYFSGKPIPKPEPEEQGSSKDGSEVLGPLSIIDHSPDSARLLIFGSGEFLSDIVITLSRSGGQDRFLNSLECFQNAVDWAVEDEDLLAIRSRGTHSRILLPTTHDTQSLLEYANYGGALVALLAVGVFGGIRQRRERPMELT